jgi:death on curing protein
MTQYLEIVDALQVVDGYGFHVSDVGLLASALARPGTTVQGTDAYPDLAVKAAAMLDAVARFHPLLDGNKRTAWTLMLSFPWINGCKHNFVTNEAFDLVLGVDAGTIGLEQWAVAIAAHIVPRSATTKVVRSTVVGDDFYSGIMEIEVFPPGTLFLSYWSVLRRIGPYFRRNSLLPRVCKGKKLVRIPPWAH